jgi:redox-sensitive bicupin YhaK (pirin superfamily)
MAVIFKLSMLIGASLSAPLAAAFLHASIAHDARPGDADAVTRAYADLWIAGAGIVHSELPTERLFAEGGRVHALQIWINLPRARKMERPRYQDVAAARLPVLVDHERWVRVIAGAHRGAISPVEAGRPVSFVHLDFAAGARDVFTLPPGSTALIYVMTGSAVVRDREVGAQTIAIARNVDEFPLAAGDDGCTAVVLAAQPLHEPVVSRGPFVMNTLAEIEHAYDDLFAGTLGVEARVD